MKQYICIDIGGTATKFGIIQENEIFLVTDEIPTIASAGGSGILNRISGIVTDFLKQYNPEGICISTAGMVDCEKGEITYASPLIPNYTGTKLKQIMEDLSGLPCEVENDVNCAGLAEYYAGAAKGSSISLCLTIGTGIGGSIIMDGKVFHGFSGSGCEIGYMHLPGGQFQDLGASSVLVRRVTEIKQITYMDINGKWVFERAIEGDSDCIRAIDEMVDVLGMGIANICYVINPEIVVLGGGIMAQKEYLYPKIYKSLKKHLIPTVFEHTKLALAENKNRAGMLGAYYHFKSRRGII